MKDYNLSEIREICKRRYKEKGYCACDGCEGDEFCKKRYDNPQDWSNIEPRDMIELPCKEHMETEYVDVWDVYCRDEKYGFVRHEVFGSEANADAFLAELKGDKE